MYKIIDEFISLYPNSNLAYYGYESIEGIIIKVGLDQRRILCL